MVTPAMQLASKIPDIHVQLWGSAILKDLHRMSKDAIHEKEAYANHVKYSENLIADQLKCVQSVHHALIDWLSGPPPITEAITAGNSIAAEGQLAMQQAMPSQQLQAIEVPKQQPFNSQQMSIVNTNAQQQQAQPHNPTQHNVVQLLKQPQEQHQLQQQQHQPQLSILQQQQQNLQHPIPSTSHQVQKHLQQQQILLQQQLSLHQQQQHHLQQHQAPPTQLIMNATTQQQPVQYIQQQVGPQVQQQQFGQYY